MDNSIYLVEKEELPIFKTDKMERLLKKDLFAAKLFEGLKSGTKEQRLEIVFNSCVLADSQMTRSYLEE